MTTPIQRSFAGGELAPSLHARVDQSRYATAAKTLRNFFVMRQGGVANRPGSQYLAEVKNSDDAARLIPFVYNSDQTYVLEFGDQYMRVYRNGARLEVSSVTAWSNATAYVVGDLALEAGVNYYCIAAHTNQQPANATYWYALDGDVYEIPTPYLAADLAEIRYEQVGDVVRLAHPSYPLKELTRTADTTWVLSTFAVDPVIGIPDNVAVSGGQGTSDTWVVTAIAEDTYEESLASDVVGSDSEASAGSPRTISWDAVTGAQEYNVYKGLNGVYGFVGVAVGTTFVDDGIDPDVTDTPPVERDPISAAGDYPACLATYQGRLMVAGSDNDPERIDGSRSGIPTNFTISSPLQDDDAVRFYVSGRQVNRVIHLIDIGVLLPLTTGGEWTVKGNGSGVLTPNEINQQQQPTGHGAYRLRPIIVGGGALYVQARGTIIRDIAFDFQTDGYRGNDRTIWSAHLFDGYTVEDWAYQQSPNSVVWAVRSDGTLLSMTYLPDQAMAAWTRHDTENGTYENVCVVPEGGEDRIYCVVRRLVNGSYHRYVERFAAREITDIVDAAFMDSHLEYDGNNAGATTLEVSGGTSWDSTETLTLTASANQFIAGDVGNEYWITGTDGTVVKFRVIAYSSPTEVTARSNKTVPAGMRTTAFTTWARAVDEISGLDHLEGETVAVFADGVVVGSPHNPAYTEYVVASGAVTLDACYAVIRAGLPIVADLETLDPDSPQGETTADKNKIVGKVVIYVEDSRGIFAGPQAPEDDVTYDEDAPDRVLGLFEMKARDGEGYDEPTDLASGVVEVLISGKWGRKASVFVRQVDPLPLKILAVAPSGLIPYGR
jgi:hypothetical protein